MTTLARAGIVRASSAVMFLCDMQDKFRTAITHFPLVLEGCRRLVEAGTLLNVPIIATEQYPKALGRTVAELAVVGRAGTTVFEKTQFSMLTPEVRAALESHRPQRNAVVLFGIESHVCVQQTALDLLAMGVDVHVVADAASSRTKLDRMLALERMRASGAHITSTESMIFQLLGDAKHPQFRQVQKLIIEPMAPSLDL
eukprot:m.239880 g.239880  ORF g.239880 m.239880 type:complete len:199 (-) comp13563_c0_seq1:61-657(-)